jgi:hypothetical protein
MVKYFEIMSKWFKRKLTNLYLSMSNVEKNAFNQKGDVLSNDIGIVQRNTQGQLADSLVNGEITQEVIDLRWRTYKILQETQNVSSKIVGFDKSGYAIVETKKIDKNRELKKVNLDKIDNYPLDMVISNDPITIGVNDIMGNDYIDKELTPVINDDGKEITASHGTISGEKFYATFKSETPIKVDRHFFPKFMIENFTKKLNVRHINNDEKLLEFYVSKYPDKEIKTTSLFINQIKKAIENPISVNFLNIDKVNFVTYKCLGVVDFLHFEYDNLLFDKIIEFNGYYIIKYKAKLVINGEPILQKYKSEELELRYKNKEAK